MLKMWREIRRMAQEVNAELRMPKVNGIETVNVE